MIIPEVLDVAARATVSLDGSRIITMPSPRFVFGPDLQTFLYPRAFTFEEFVDGSSGLLAVPVILKALERPEIPLARLLEGRDGQLGELILSRKRSVLCGMGSELGDWAGGGHGSVRVGLAV